MQVLPSNEFAGRVPNVKNLNLDAVGVELHPDGAIKVYML
jgi:pyruvate/2-oxoglutarate dehydrogenase complex dihydrolipoamide dehydrogenase (E3) component